MIVTPYNKNNNNFEFHFKEGDKDILRKALINLDWFQEEHLKENSILFTDFQELEDFATGVYEFYKYVKEDHIDNPGEYWCKEDWYWTKGQPNFDKEVDNSEISTNKRD